MDSPTNYWPPHVGREFTPEGQANPRNMISDEDYPQMLVDNPMLKPHVDFLT
jgi:hypothetical protein